MEFERKLRRKPPPIERKPKQTMLKELLRDDFSSCSSNGFLSYPRRQSSCYTSMRSLLDMDLKPKLLSSKEVKRTAFQKASAAVINVVRQLQFSQKQGILPRSFSRRLKMSFTKKGSVEHKMKGEMRVVIKVKDILRWKSFKDSIQEKQNPKPLLCSSSPSLSPSPLQTTTATTTTTTSSNSWSDSDFSSGSGSGSWEYCSKKYISENNKTNSLASNEDSMVEEKSQETKYEEKDQFSPVSVLDFPFEEDDDSSSSFQSSLENMERTKHKLMNKIRRFENLAKIEPLDLEKRIVTLEQDGSSYPSDSQSNSINNDVEILDQEEDEGFIKATNKAIELLNCFNATSSKECIADTTNDLLLDFFRDEILEKTLTKKKNSTGEEFNYELLKVAKEWMVGKNVLLDWQVEESRRVHIKEMERGGEWGGELQVERRESAMELEVEVLNMLIDEMVCDLLC